MIKLRHLKSLPVKRFLASKPLVLRVRSSCTIKACLASTSVRPLLIGQQLSAPLRHDWFGLFLRSQFVKPLPPLPLCGTAMSGVTSAVKRSAAPLFVSTAPSEPPRGLAVMTDLQSPDDTLNRDNNLLVGTLCCCRCWIPSASW